MHMYVPISLTAPPLPPRDMRAFRRRLHARAAKGCATIMRSHQDALRFSPVHGCLAWGSPILTALWDAGSCSSSPAVARLARALFHRHELQEPLRVTQNRSLPGAHLAGRPALHGHFLGLALRQAPSREVREHFSKLGVAAIARDEGVSLVRFEGLVRLLRDSLQSHDREEVPLGLCGSAVLLAHLWGSAASKQCLLEFLAALQEHVPSLLDERSELHCPEWRRAWLDMAFGTDRPLTKN